MPKLSPTVEEIEALRKEAPPGPVVIVNLLKFKPGSGKKAYVDYMRACEPRSGGAGAAEVIYAGEARADIAAGEEWDYVILARYPNFAAFADFVTSREYQDNAIPIRPDALEKTLFMISRPMPIAEYFKDEG